MRAVVIVVLLFTSSIPSAVAEVLTGAQLFVAKGCHICHGLEGRNPLSEKYPLLAGQNAPYLIQQMLDIKSGKRNNALSPTMRTILEFVNEEEIVRIAQYLERLSLFGSRTRTNR